MSRHTSTLQIVLDRHLQEHWQTIIDDRYVEVYHKNDSPTHWHLRATILINESTITIYTDGTDLVLNHADPELFAKVDKHIQDYYLTEMPSYLRGRYVDEMHCECVEGTMDDDDDELLATGYIYTQWDCPNCSEVNEAEGDIKGELHECEFCDSKVRIR